MLKFKYFRRRFHFRSQANYHLFALLAAHLLYRLFALVLFAGYLDNIANALDYCLGHNSVLFVICHLLLASAFGLNYCALHRRGNGVGIHDNLAVRVSRRASYRLYQRCFGAQEALLVGIKNYDERNLRNIQSLAQQVYAYEHIKLTEAQIADNFHSFYRINIVVHIAHFYAEVFEIIRQIFRHLLCERSQKNALFALDSYIYLGYNIVYLTLGRSD